MTSMKCISPEFKGIPGSLFMLCQGTEEMAFTLGYFKRKNYSSPTWDRRYFSKGLVSLAAPAETRTVSTMHDAPGRKVRRPWTAAGKEGGGDGIVGWHTSFSMMPSSWLLWVGGTKGG